MATLLEYVQGGKARIARAARAAGRDVTMLTRVAPELIGGIVVRMGSRMYDASLKGKLDRLRVVMKGVG